MGIQLSAYAPPFFAERFESRMETQVESQSELERKINALEKSLQEQISQKRLGTRALRDQEQPSLGAW